MTIKFATFGPYELKEMTPAAIDKLYVEIGSKLQFGIGVYIFAARNADGTMVPWYVGKTNKEFGARLFQHFQGQWIYDLFEQTGELSLFLIARVTPAGKFKKLTAKSSRKKGLISIHRLEWSLIGSCLSKNPALINKQGSSFFKTVVVPGYWNTPPNEVDMAAKSLAEMLGARQ